jgi:hypothetical protein
MFQLTFENKVIDPKNWPEQDLRVKSSMYLQKGVEDLLD